MVLYMKEFIRKTMVSIKRSPQTIALVALMFAFIYYSFNLTTISDTTAKIQGKNMGLCGFVTMLFSILVFVCFLNAFPKRSKPRVAMLVLVYAMLALIFTADWFYRLRITEAIAREDFAAVIENNAFIMEAYHVVLVHSVLVCVVAVLIALLPVYSKLLRKIKTSVNLEYSTNMEAIDIEDE